MIEKIIPDSRIIGMREIRAANLVYSLNCAYQIIDSHIVHNNKSNPNSVPITVSHSAVPIRKTTPSQKEKYGLKEIPCLFDSYEALSQADSPVSSDQEGRSSSSLLPETSKREESKSFKSDFPACAYDPSSLGKESSKSESPKFEPPQNEQYRNNDLRDTYNDSVETPGNPDQQSPNPPQDEHRNNDLKDTYNDSVETPGNPDLESSNPPQDEHRNNDSRATYNDSVETPGNPDLESSNPPQDEQQHAPDHGPSHTSSTNNKERKPSGSSSHSQTHILTIPKCSKEPMNSDKKPELSSSHTHKPSSPAHSPTESKHDDEPSFPQVPDSMKAFVDCLKGYSSIPFLHYLHL